MHHYRINIPVVRPLGMTFGPRLSGKLRNVIMYVIWANQKTEFFVYCWLRAHAKFDVTCFPAFVVHRRSFQAFCWYLNSDSVRLCLPAGAELAVYHGGGVYMAGTQRRHGDLCAPAPGPAAAASAREGMLCRLTLESDAVKMKWIWFEILWNRFILWVRNFVVWRQWICL